MRFIDQEKLRPKIAHLLSPLEAAAEAVLQESDPKKRRDIFAAHQRDWTALREAMAEISHNKCWYTESKNPGADDDIDHFRPKSGVARLRGHPGYYWLAFDWENYRLSCHHSNRLRRSANSAQTGGKGTKFPLIDEGRRAYKPDDDWKAEQPVFLDPCDPADPPLLTFRPTGESALSPQWVGDSIAERRWKTSRLDLHIDWPDFVDDRIALFHQVERIVLRGQRAAPARGERPYSQAFKDAVRDLLDSMEPKSAYSMAARAYVEFFGSIWWVDEIALRV